MEFLINILDKMYLPTFWKLTAEAQAHRFRHIAGWGMPIGTFLLWVGKDSIYNMYYSVIVPPPRGVAKKS